MHTSPRQPPDKDHTPVPIFKLYGYGNIWTVPDLMYCETIAAQEKLHNWHVKPHKHADLFQLLYLQSGHARVHIDGATRPLLADQILLVPQMVVHGFRFDPDSVGYILTVTYALMTQIDQAAGLTLTAAGTPTVLELADRPDEAYVRLSFQRLNEEYRSPNTPQRTAQLQAILSTILVWAHRHIQTRADTRPNDPRDAGQHLAEFTQLIEKHYTEHHLVAWYAREIGITPAHLNVVAQAGTEKSALQLIHERVLLEARRELIYTTRTIKIISYSLGFADPGYFTRFFKRGSGLSPKDFRRQTGTQT
ncbi:MAG: helix-turn-helix domain-containing protein [Alcaligenaceae bacterium]|nr:helix-turn-helix domain-containing protein [Alcaligenaceae bacterium]